MLHAPESMTLTASKAGMLESGALKRFCRCMIGFSGVLDRLLTCKVHPLLSCHSSQWVVFTVT